MAKMTVIEMVQDILSDMDSDEVNSINDTLEALQVAQILKTTYFEIIAQRDWPHLGTITQLTGASNSANPTRFKIDDDIQKVEWIKYDARGKDETRKAFIPIKYVSPMAFIERTNAYNSDNDSILTITANGVDILINSDKSPQFYTTFDDEYIIMDSYNSNIENNLLQSKTQMFAYREPLFNMIDGFTADLPSKAFPYYLAEAKSVAFNALKQVPNAKEEQRSRRLRYKVAQDVERAEQPFVNYPNYGRK